jgi:hypothetical protein
MLTVYADESGTHGNSPIVAVGGYVSTVELWSNFQIEWVRFVDEDVKAEFHTTDMLALQGDFAEDKGWNRNRIDQVLARADAIIESHVLFGVASYTEIKECEKVFPLKDKNGTRKKFSAEYLLSAVQLSWSIAAWAKENGYTEPIDYVFESGASGAGYLLQALDHGRKVDSLIGSVSFADKKRVYQLHSADKLVQQSRRAIVRFLAGHETDVIAGRLIKAKLGKVMRMDSENLPLLRDFAEAQLIERNKEQDTGRNRQ